MALLDYRMGPHVVEMGGRGGGLLNQAKVELTNQIALMYLCLLCESLWMMGVNESRDPSKPDVSYARDIPLLDYVHANMETIWTTFFTSAFVGQLNFWHTIGSKLGAYAVSIDKAMSEKKKLKPEDWLTLFGIYPVIVGFFYGKPVTATEIMKNPVPLIEGPRVSWINNEIVVNKCPTTISFKGGRKRRTRRVKHF